MGLKLEFSAAKVTPTSVENCSLYNVIKNIFRIA